MTTRFEAILYVGLIGLSVVSVPGRRAFWAVFVTGVMGYLAVRHGDLTGY